MTVETTNLRSGADRGAVLQALAAGEAGRQQALAATLSLMVGAGLAFGAADIFFRGSAVQTLIGIVVAAAIWRLSNFMWRPRAIAIAAPLVGEHWGQERLDVGLAAIDWAEWWEAWNLRGYRLVGWRSSGSYRDIRYSLQEVTIRKRCQRSGPSHITHHVMVDIALPAWFSGTIDILPSGGVLTLLDDALRTIVGDEMPRVEVEPHFDSRFDTLVGAGADVEKLLTPRFQATMMSLAQQHPVSGRFSQGWFKLHLSVPDVAFGAARLQRPLTDLVEEADRLWWELTVPHRLIDALMGDHSGPIR